MNDQIYKNKKSVYYIALNKTGCSSILAVDQRAQSVWRSVVSVLPDCPHSAFSVLPYCPYSTISVHSSFPHSTFSAHSSCPHSTFSAPHSTVSALHSVSAPRRSFWSILPCAWPTHFHECQKTFAEP